MWYQRHECGLRMSIFFSMATAAGAFGGLLARGIAEMDGVGGKRGWSWIFILEGSATVLVALWAYSAFKDYPETAKFLTPTEKHEVHRRLEEDRSSLADEFDRKFVWDAFKDWKIYAHCFNFLGYVCVALQTELSDKITEHLHRSIHFLYSFRRSLEILVIRTRKLSS
jgi:MFS family permease